MPLVMFLTKSKPLPHLMSISVEVICSKMFSNLKGEGRALLANVPQVVGNQVLSGNKTATAFAAEHLTCTKTDTRSFFGSEEVIKRGDLI